jgi:PKD domain
VANRPPAGGHRPLFAQFGPSKLSPKSPSPWYRLLAVPRPSGPLLQRTPPCFAPSSPNEWPPVRDDEIARDTSASTDPDGTITTYDWDFGEGTKGAGLNPTLTYLPGTDAVLLLITDHDGLKPIAVVTAIPPSVLKTG